MSKEILILNRLDQLEKLAVLSAKKALTVDDVSLLTGLSKSYIYSLTSTKQIPFYKPNGKQLYFDKADIEKWMLSNKVESIAESERRALNHCL